MKFKKIDDSTFIIRLEVGKEISEEIITFCKDLDINFAEIRGIGAVGKTELMHYNVEKKEYSSKSFNEEMEICSLTGFITSAGLHAHITIANNKMQTFGGHLKSAYVSATVEILLKILPGKMDRKYDEFTGLKLMDI